VETASLFIAAALVDNLVLAKLAALGTVAGATRGLDRALTLAAATAFVVVPAVPIAFLVERHVLGAVGLGYLSTFADLLLVAALTALADGALRAWLPASRAALGARLPLVAGSVAVLAIVVAGADADAGLGDRVARALGAATGFALALVVFAGLDQRLAASDVPAPFRGVPIVLVSAAILSLAFTGFSGIG